MLHRAEFAISKKKFCLLKLVKLIQEIRLPLFEHVKCASQNATHYACV